MYSDSQIARKSIDEMEYVDSTKVRSTSADFPTWLDGELAQLEEAFGDFVTAQSLRRHFGGGKRRR